MREIKFRIWNHSVKKMNYLTSKMVKIDSNGCLSTKDPFSSVDSEILQYTGLKDKNDKEIYEGDVVTWNDGDYEHESNPRLAVVEFSPELSFYAFNCEDMLNDKCKYTDKDGYGRKFSYGNFIYTDTEKHLEVIGNIRENPELINK